MIETHLPKGLRRISLFEDTNEDYIALFRHGHLWPQGLPNPVQIVTPALSAAFARGSLVLEQLSVAFMAEARDFFEARQPQWYRGSLQSLALTVAAAHPDNPARADLPAAGGRAAVCALRMPELHTMAIWSGSRGTACAFTYRKGGGDRPSLTLRATWPLELEPRVVRAWEEVAAEHTLRDGLLVRMLAVLPDVIDSHGDAIRYLGLPDGVIDPVSLWQIRRETATGWRRI